MTDISVRDLPLWMRQAQRRTDWALVFVFAFSLFAAWMFLLQPGFASSSANLNHAFLASDIATGLREGQLYPRWSPHVFGGYGAPILNYVPPGAAYLVALVEVLFTNDTLTALRLVYVGVFCLTALVVYALSSHWVGSGGGIISALLYTFSPYFGLVVPHILGDLPQMITLLLLPCLLWASNRLLKLDQTLDFLVLTLITSLLTFTNPSALIIGLILQTPLIMLHWWDAKQRYRIILAYLAMILGLSGAIVFWLPALAEQNEIIWQAPPLSAITYRLSLPELVSPLQQIDPGELAPTPQFTLGWIFAPITLLGTVAIGLQWRKYRYPLAFLVIGTLLLIAGLILLPEHTSLLGTITLCYAVVGGAVSGLVKNFYKPLQRIFLVTLIALILIGSLPIWLLPRPAQSIGEFTPVDQVRYEQQGLGIAVLPIGANVPTTLASGSATERELISSYFAEGIGFRSDNLAKISPVQMMRNGQITIISQNAYTARYLLRFDRPMLNSPNTRSTTPPVPITWLTTYFPGWQATLNDLPLPIQQNPVNGLIDLHVPQTNNGELTIRWGSTPVRDLSWIISLCALLIVLLITRQRFRIRAGIITLADDSTLLSPEESRLVLVLLLCFTIMFTLSIMPNSPVKLRPTANFRLQGITTDNIQTEVGLQLFGYQLENQRYHPGEVIEVDLFWRALRPLPGNYQVRLYLQDVNRITNWVEQPLRSPGGYPTRRWSTTHYVRDTYTLRLPGDIFEGSYQIKLEVYQCDRSADCVNGERLTFFDAINFTPEQVLSLAPVITITR